MADHTVPGIIGIVAVVLIVAVFFQAGPQAMPADSAEESVVGANLAGGAYSSAVKNADGCEPTRFCDGTKLVIVREDCSVAESFCRSGCLSDQKICA